MDQISVREAARRLGVTTRTVQRMIRDGRLEGWKLNPELPSSPYVVDADSVGAQIQAQLEVEQARLLYQTNHN